MKKLIFALNLILVLSLIACGGESAPPEAAGHGDAVAGEKLFEQSLIGTQAGCIACHSLEPGVTIVGPSLAVIGADAGSRVSGQSAEEYLRQSIIEPDAYVVEGFASGLMPNTLVDELTEQQINDLVAFLQTLK